VTVRIEIVPASRGLAVVETYVGGRRTAMSEALPLPAARIRGECAAGRSGDVVDHTRTRADRGDARRLAVGRMARGDFRP
jgi:hypothetical protein